MNPWKDCRYRVRGGHGNPRNLKALPIQDGGLASEVWHESPDGNPDRSPDHALDCG